MTDEPLMGTAWLVSVLRGGLISNPDIALKICELILLDIQGPAILDKQRPLSVTDQADRWVVEGVASDDPAEAWRGKVRIAISKKDGRVIELHAPAIRYVYSGNSTE